MPNLEAIDLGLNWLVSLKGLRKASWKQLQKLWFRNLFDIQMGIMFLSSRPMRCTSILWRKSPSQEFLHREFNALTCAGWPSWNSINSNRWVSVGGCRTISEEHCEAAKGGGKAAAEVFGTNHPLIWIINNILYFVRFCFFCRAVFCRKTCSDFRPK